MGSFLFKWTHPATEVYVTGTFDDWAKSAKLDKTAAGHFEKLVDLPSAEEKVVYKFVVDDNWTTDHTAPTQIDEHGNSNNILLPEHITKKSTGTVGGVAADLPGAFPATPATNTENQTFSVNPIPATGGVGNPVQLKPGEKVPDPSSLTKNTIASTATMDKESYDKSPSGAPLLPNPITPDTEREKEGAGLFGLPPGNKNLIPESSLPIGAGALGAGLEKDPGVTIQGGGGAPTTAALAGQVPLEPRGVPTTEIDKDLTIQSGGGAPSTAVLAGQVPLEPRGVPSTEVDKDLTIQGGGGSATTAALAGQVPVEPRGVPQVVQDSQEQAFSAARGASVEASANPEAVLEKKSVEQEIEKTVPTSPATSGEQSVGSKVAEIAGGVAAGATAAVAAAAAYASKAKDDVTSDETKDAAKAQAVAAQETAGNAATQAKETATSAAMQAQTSAMAAATAAKAKLPESVQQRIDSVLPASVQGTGNEPAAPTVPEPVKESIAEAHQPAEAAVNPTQVSNKAAVEDELKEVVQPAQSAGAPAPTVTAATSATGPSAAVPSAAAAVAIAGTSAEKPLPATTGNTSVLGKSTETPLNAPANAPTTTSAANPKPQDSRDVSPMTRTDGQQKPVATSGVATSTVPESSGPIAGAGASTNISTTNPAVSAAKQAAKSPTDVPPASPASTRTNESGTKNKRRSFFGRMKDKIHHHKRSESKSES